MQTKFDCYFTREIKPFGVIPELPFTLLHDLNLPQANSDCRLLNISCIHEAFCKTYFFTKILDYQQVFRVATRVRVAMVESRVESRVTKVGSRVEFESFVQQLELFFVATRVESLTRVSPTLLSAWVTQLRRKVAVVASRWRYCAWLDRPGIQTPDIPHR